jgi:hypothetical protein
LVSECYFEEEDGEGFAEVVEGVPPGTDGVETVDGGGGPGEEGNHASRGEDAFFYGFLVEVFGFFGLVFEADFEAAEAAAEEDQAGGDEEHGEAGAGEEIGVVPVGRCVCVEVYVEAGRELVLPDLETLVDAFYCCLHVGPFYFCGGGAIKLGDYFVGDDG